MTLHHPHDLPPSLDGLLQPALDAVEGPMLAVDTRSLSVVAANRGARTLLGIELGALPVLLDRTMPAARTLRAISLEDGALDEPAETNLVFWTSRGAVSIPASVATYGTTRGGVVLVRALAANEQNRPRPAGGLDAPFGHDDDKGPFLARSERDTLREIARRIREGQTAVVEPMTASAGHSGNATGTATAAAEGTGGDAQAAAEETVTNATASPSASQVAVDESGASAPPTAAREHDTSNGSVSIQSPGAMADTALPTPSVSSSGPSHTKDDGAGVLAPDALQRAKLAHELKTPIGAIATAAEIMAGARFGALGDPRYQAYADEMLINARHALTLIDRMLARKPAAGKEPPVLRFERFDLNALVASSVSAVEATAAAKGLEIGTSLAAGTPHILADQTAIRQVLLNLLGNAVKFTPSSGTVSVATLEAPGGGAIVRVSDTGPGMLDRDIAAAMRADPDSDIRQDRPGGGHGLGLAITRSLVEANGAKLEIESSGGEGTTVTVRFSGNRLIVA